MAPPPLPPGFVPEQSRSTGMFAAGKRRSPAPAIPPPPEGFQLDPLASIRATGATITSGYRSPGRNKRVGGVPNSLHLDGSALDLTPAPGQSWDQLRSLANGVATQYGNGARIVDESKTRKPHIHLQLPGWGGAPANPGPAFPAGFVAEGQAAMTPAQSKALAPNVPESTIEAMRARAIMSPDNFAPESSAPSWVATSPPMTVPQELAALNRLTNPGATPPPEAPRFGIAPGINAVTSALTGNPAPIGDSSVSVGGFFDELPEEVRRKLTTPQIEQYLALARNGGSAADLQALFKGFGYDIANADAIVAAIAKGAAVNRGIDYRLPETKMTDGAKGSFARGFADPFNFLDEAGGVVDTLGGTQGRESIFNSERPFGDILDANIDRNRGVLAADERDHPYARLGGQLTSGILLPVGGGARTAGQLAKFGALEGFAAGAGAGEGNPLERLPNAAVGAGFGAGGGAILGKLVDGGATALSAARQRLLGSASAEGSVARDAAFAAAPVVDDAMQAAGPTPASRFQPQGGAQDFGLNGFRRAAQDIEANAPPLAPGHVRLWKAENGRGFTTDLAGVALPIRNGRGGDLGYIDLPEEDAALYAVDGGFKLPTALAGQTKSLRPANGSPWAAMAMDDQAPEISQRVRDYINIPPLPPGFIPEMRRVEDVSRLMDVESAAKGIAPEDVLPPAAYAPDEYASLGSRTFPRAGGRPAYQRGPVDLVGFVRSRGGLQDEGGELSHLGIDNRPRNMDFAQGEGFLGGLVRGDGHSLDDMAEAAWEAGYFHERPSVNEFLDALADTHAGHNRLFHPEDLGEVAEFEANREQRLAMEAAGEGMPEVRRVANINVEKIETPQDIRQALASIHGAIGDNPSLARVSHEETARLAEQLGMTPEDFLKRRQGQPLNHAEAFALRELHAASLDSVFAAAKKAIGGSDADRAAFLKAVNVSAALGDHASGAAAETGRALSQYRMIAKASKHSKDAIKALIDGRGGPRSIDDLAEAIVELEKDPANASRFIQKVSKPGFRDMFNELYVNSLVSGPQTHAVNIISNLATMVAQIPEHALAASMGALRPGSTDKVYFSEIGPRIVGMLQGAKTGLAQAKRALITGHTSDEVQKVESRFQHAIPGKVGHVLRTPTRLLAAEDEFFKGSALGFELAGQAVRRAKAEGLKGEALTKRIAAINADPSAEMLKAGKDFARYVTFQRQLGTLGQAASRVSNEVPGAKVIVPFVRTPTNLLKFAVERSPLAPLLREWRSDIMAGGARRDLALVRAASGSSLGMLAASWAAEGRITGGGPADMNARRTLMASGWQPYSIKIGDRYYSYQRLDPIATTLGMAADFVDKQSRMTPDQADEYAATLSSSIMQNLENKVWLQGIADLSEAIDGRDGGAYVRKTLATMAVPVGVSQLAQATDGQLRESKTVGEAIQARIPGLSDNLRPRLDAWGLPIPQRNNLGPDILSPFYRSDPRNSAISKEALRLGLKLSEPSRKVGDMKLSDEQFHAYRNVAGQLLTQRFGQLIGSPEWQSMTDDEKRKAFERPKTGLKAQARADARALLGLGPDAEGGVTVPPPPGSSQTIPPLPPGFVIDSWRGP